MEKFKTEVCFVSEEKQLEQVKSQEVIKRQKSQKKTLKLILLKIKNTNKQNGKI